LSGQDFIEQAFHRRPRAAVDLFAAAVIDVARLHKKFRDPSNDKEPELHICLEVAQPKSKGRALPIFGITAV
jgi:hypothetical protein